MPQDGVRAYEFTATPGVLQMLLTDFAVVPQASFDGANTDYTLVLKSTWELTDGTKTKGRQQRVYLEDRVKAIQWTYVGTKGTLITDKGTTEAKTYAGITLLSADFSVDDQNVMVEYTLTFGYPTVPNIARTIIFNGLTVNALDFTVEKLVEDKTVFKEVFRAAPVRVAGGVGIKTIRVLGIRQALTGATDLARRQNAESIINTWSGTHVGVSATLTIDGASLGTAHLASCTPSVLSQNDVVVYDLEFKQNWVA